jgi:hypothetical protein
MTPITSQQFESYVPVYDVVPEKWEDARQFLVEHLKKISNAVNIRTIGWLLDEELLSGQQFIPGVIPPGNMTGAQFRSVLRYVLNAGALTPGANTYTVGNGMEVPIIIDANFTLIHMYGAAQNHTAPFASEPLPNGADTLMLNDTTLTITVASAWDQAYIIIEYLQEL